MKKLFAIICLGTLVPLSAQEAKTGIPAAPAIDNMQMPMEETQPAMQAPQPQTEAIQLTAEEVVQPEPTKTTPTMQEQRMVNIGLSSKARQQSAALLHNLLANEYVLYVKTQKFHWNVEGPLFGPLHALFGKQYEQLAGFVDMIAEHSLALGIKSIGTLKEFMEYATITEMSGVNPEAQGMIKELLQDHETIIQQLQTAITITNQLGDMGTNNFLNDLLEKHQKTAWMLRAHLQ